jgi:CspA family cold shock protein
MEQEVGGGVSALEVIFTIRGTVKWFNPAKGFGFVTPEDGSGDVFMHLSSLRQSGFETVPDGVGIVCEAARRSKGVQVVRVVELATAQAPDLGDRGEQQPCAKTLEERSKSRFPPIVAEGDFEPATVKWFSVVKGYGFLTTGETDPDIFIHVAILRRHGVSDLMPGQSVMVRIGQGPKGPQATDIRL